MLCALAECYIYFGCALAHKNPENGRVVYTTFSPQRIVINEVFVVLKTEKVGVSNMSDGCQQSSITNVSFSTKGL